jgi:CHRD domain
MTTRTRRGLTAAALCTAGLVVAGAPLALATNGKHNPGKRDDHPGKHHKPSYGQPGFKPGKPGSGALFATLLGRKEVTDAGKRKAGDLDGLGTATIGITKSNQVCWGIVVQGIDTPTAAHIHQARPGKNGGIVVPLSAPTAGDPGASSGCTAVDPGLAFDLRKHPHSYYVNVHTTAFPNGALRGQLHKAPFFS